jgi:hypothetical protein
MAHTPHSKTVGLGVVLAIVPQIQMAGSTIQSGLSIIGAMRERIWALNKRTERPPPAHREALIPEMFAKKANIENV